MNAMMKVPGTCGLNVSVGSASTKWHDAVSVSRIPHLHKYTTDQLYALCLYYAVVYKARMVPKD